MGPGPTWPPKGTADLAAERREGAGGAVARGHLGAVDQTGQDPHAVADEHRLGRIADDVAEGDDRHAQTQVVRKERGSSGHAEHDQAERQAAGTDDRLGRGQIDAHRDRSGVHEPAQDARLVGLQLDADLGRQTGEVHHRADVARQRLGQVEPRRREGFAGEARELDLDALAGTRVLGEQEHLAVEHAQPDRAERDAHRARVAEPEEDGIGEDRTVRDVPDAHGQHPGSGLLDPALEHDREGVPRAAVVVLDLEPLGDQPEVLQPTVNLDDGRAGHQRGEVEARRVDRVPDAVDQQRVRVGEDRDPPQGHRALVVGEGLDLEGQGAGIADGDQPVDLLGRQAAEDPLGQAARLEGEPGVDRTGQGRQQVDVHGQGGQLAGPEVDAVLKRKVQESGDGRDRRPHPAGGPRRDGVRVELEGQGRVDAGRNLGRRDPPEGLVEPGQLEVRRHGQQVLGEGGVRPLEADADQVDGEGGQVLHDRVADQDAQGRGRLGSASGAPSGRDVDPLVATGQGEAGEETGRDDGRTERRGIGGADHDVGWERTGARTQDYRARGTGVRSAPIRTRGTPAAPLQGVFSPPLGS